MRELARRELVSDSCCRLGRVCAGRRGVKGGYTMTYRHIETKKHTFECPNEAMVNRMRYIVNALSLVDSMENQAVSAARLDLRHRRVSFFYEADSKRRPTRRWPCWTLMWIRAWVERGTELNLLPPGSNPIGCLPLSRVSGRYAIYDPNGGRNEGRWVCIWGMYVLVMSEIPTTSFLFFSFLCRTAVFPAR